MGRGSCKANESFHWLTNRDNAVMQGSRFADDRICGSDRQVAGPGGKGGMGCGTRLGQRKTILLQVLYHMGISCPRPVRCKVCKIWARKIYIIKD